MSDIESIRQTASDREQIVKSQQRLYAEHIKLELLEAGGDVPVFTPLFMEFEQLAAKSKRLKPEELGRIFELLGTLKLAFGEDYIGVVACWKDVRDTKK